MKMASLSLSLLVLSHHYGNTDMDSENFSFTALVWISLIVKELELLFVCLLAITFFFSKYVFCPSVWIYLAHCVLLILTLWALWQSKIVFIDVGSLKL